MSFRTQKRKEQRQRQKEREMEEQLLQDFGFEEETLRTPAKERLGVTITEGKKAEPSRWVEKAKPEEKGKAVMVEQLPPRPIRKRQWLPKNQGQTSAAPADPMIMMVETADPKKEYWSDDEYWSDNEPTAQICFDGVASVVMPIEGANTQPPQSYYPKAEPLVIMPPVPAMSDHVKPLQMKGWVNSKPFSRMLIDGGAAVNIMTIKTLYKLGKRKEELIPTKSAVTSFMGDPSMPLGCLLADVTIGSITTPTMFFVMNTEAAYSVLLGRDWIHSARCVPSTFHQKAWF